jgi:hypothetical protein
LAQAVQIDKDFSSKDDKYKGLILKENEELRRVITEKDAEYVFIFPFLL